MDEQDEMVEPVIKAVEALDEADQNTAPEAAGDVVDTPTEPAGKKPRGKVSASPVDAETCCVKAVEGDSYLTIAAKYCPPGRTVREFASVLLRVNGARPIRVGTKVYLKETK